MPSLMGLIPAGPNSSTPGQEGEEDVRDRTGARDDARAVSDDKRLLNADDFDPAACKSQILNFLSPF